jgi:hypothetical protein
MKSLLRLGAIALACLAMPAAAQSVGSSVIFPSGWAPGQSICVRSVTDGTCVPVSSASPLPVTAAPSASAPVQQGGTIAAGGTAAIAFVSGSDTEIVNPSGVTLWGSWGTPAANGVNSYPINAGGSYRPPNRPVGTFTLLNPNAAAQPYTATRF